MTLAFARIELDPAHPFTLRVLGDPYRMHRFVYETAAEEDGDSRLLYRVEPAPNSRDGKYQVLVQRTRAWEGHEYSGAAEGYTVERRTKEVTLVPQTYRFRLRANPVKTVPSAERGVRGKRVGLENEEEQLHWLAGKLAGRGMRLVAADRHREPWVVFAKGGNGTRRVSLVSALFEGTLRVEDPANAEEGLEHGIGPGKGFGFGLLSLAAQSR